jgi:DNA-binding GntR family transcriptional regulator
MLANQSTSEVVAETLRNDITYGRIAPGSALRQEELAERFAVSRIPIREALRELERDGLVRVLPNRGAFVVRLSGDEILEITNLRILIERDLVANAVPRCDTCNLLAIKEAERTARRLASTAEWIEADRAFHRALYAPAGRPRQLELAMSLRRELERYQSIYGRLPDQRKTWLADHRNIVEAFFSGNAEEACAFMERHIRAAGAFLADKATRCEST